MEHRDEIKELKAAQEEFARRQEAAITARQKEDAAKSGRAFADEQFTAARQRLDEVTRQIEIAMRRGATSRARGARRRRAPASDSLGVRALRFLREHPGAQRVADIAKFVGAKPETTRTILNRLADEGSVERVERGMWRAKGASTGGTTQGGAGASSPPGSGLDDDALFGRGGDATARPDAGGA